MGDRKSKEEAARGTEVLAYAPPDPSVASEAKPRAAKTTKKRAAAKKAQPKEAAKKPTPKKAGSKKPGSKKIAKKATAKTRAKTAPPARSKRKGADKNKKKPHVAPAGKSPTPKPATDDRLPISFGVDETVNPAMPDEVHAPDLLDFEQTDELVSDLGEDDLRDRVVETLLAIEDFGIADSPAGRRAAYGDIIAGTDAKSRSALLAKDPRNSSCALVVRAVWRFLGAQDDKLLDRFVVSKPFQFVCQFARQCGAYTDVKVGDPDFSPQRGDVLVLQKGNRQHIFTLIEVDDDTFTSVDGGEPSKTLDDGTCNGIHKMVRTLHRDTFCFGTDDRPVTGWIDVSKLTFTAPRVALHRGMAESGGAESAA